MMHNHVHTRIITGVYGGSFNPIHVGHTAMAERLVGSGMVDELWLVVSPQNPLKSNDCLWDDGLRLALARLAVSGIDGVIQSVALTKTTYTDLSGKTLSHIDNAKGVFIMTEHFADGSKHTRKLVK